MCVLGEDEARDLAVPKKPWITNHQNIQAESQHAPFSDEMGQIFKMMWQDFYISKDGAGSKNTLPIGEFKKLL